MAARVMRARLCFLTAGLLAAAGQERFLAVGGNATTSVRDQGLSTVTWVSFAEAPTTGGGNLTMGKPALYISGFHVLEQQWGSGLTALDATSKRLFLLGEEQTAWNSTVAGELQLAVVDTSAEPPRLHRRQGHLPIKNCWRHVPLDDSDGHASFLAIWGEKLVLAGPTLEKEGIGFGYNFTVFILDQESLEIERRFNISMDITEVAQGPAQLDAASSTLHFAVDRVYSGQRIYHLDLSSGALQVSDVPDWYFMNFIHVPSAHALFGPAKLNEENGDRNGTLAHRLASSSTSWHWTKLDLRTGVFSNRSLSGQKCEPISNPEDNTQTVAGVFGPAHPSHCYIGLTCQNDPSDIDGFLGFIDYDSAKIDGLWHFAGLYYPSSAVAFWYLGQTGSKETASVIV